MIIIKGFKWSNHWYEEILSLSRFTISAQMACASSQALSIHFAATPYNQVMKQIHHVTARSPCTDQASNRKHRHRHRHSYIATACKINYCTHHPLNNRFCKWLADFGHYYAHWVPEYLQSLLPQQWVPQQQGVHNMASGSLGTSIFE